LLVSQGSRGVRFASEATAYQRGQMVYRQDIQILRGVAVLFVVLFHLTIGIFSRGFLGVDVFLSSADF
jgi:peptidoglycan/LPS O-acetylase OafA/YrhL